MANIDIYWRILIYRVPNAASGEIWDAVPNSVLHRRYPANALKIPPEMALIPRTYDKHDLLNT
jgi:hypothetical protein